MKKIAFFSIPAHGHTNPMLAVAQKLVERGNTVHFYSFDEFKEKIENTGAKFISCNSFLSELNETEEKKLKEVSTTEMTLQDIRITLSMDSFLSEEFAAFKPDVIYADSVCFWGKLTAWKHNIPLVVSTSTFAFNQMSSQYMKHSPKEMADMIFGISKISGELKKLEPYGYHIKNVLSLIQNDNATDTVVYTSQKFQPYAKSFSGHYAFVGPSISSEILPQKEKTRPLIYISLGTVINDRPDFYSKCIDALKDMNVDVIISCGHYMNPEILGTLPENIKVYPRVNQLEVLAKADVFITHCGMNSVSESLYMATPMVLFPQTGEQYAVARRTAEIGAGKMLKKESAESVKTAIEEILNNSLYKKAAADCSNDFRTCAGPSGAAEFIENAPHTEAKETPVYDAKKEMKIFNMIYRIILAVAIIGTGFLAGWKYVWIVAVLTGFLAYPIGNAVQKWNYKRKFK